jgi:hypothetical protein
MAIEDAMVFGGLEAARRSLALSGTRSCSLRYSLPCGARKRVSVGERETDSRRFRKDYL